MAEQTRPEFDVTVTHRLPESLVASVAPWALRTWRDRADSASAHWAGGSLPVGTPQPSPPASAAASCPRKSDLLFYLSRCSSAGRSGPPPKRHRRLAPHQVLPLFLPPIPLPPPRSAQHCFAWTRPLGPSAWEEPRSIACPGH